MSKKDKKEVTLRKLWNILSKDDRPKEPTSKRIPISTYGVMPEDLARAARGKRIKPRRIAVMIPKLNQRDGNNPR
jgi:hypothetical protein